jgi:hypothetical protein
MPSMDLRTAATRDPDSEAVEFIRFCYRRRRVGWPELYDEMCAVAARGLFRGLVTDDLAAHGIGFSLFDTPALAALSASIVVEEQAARRPMTVVITPVAEEVPAEVLPAEAVPAEAVPADDTPDIASNDAPSDRVIARPQVEPIRAIETSVRLVAVPAGA